jgi:hypothetical protein
MFSPGLPFIFIFCWVGDAAKAVLQPGGGRWETSRVGAGLGSWWAWAMNNIPNIRFPNNACDANSSVQRIVETTGMETFRRRALVQAKTGWKTFYVELRTVELCPSNTSIMSLLVPYCALTMSSGHAARLLASNNARLSNPFPCSQHLRLPTPQIPYPPPAAWADLRSLGGLEVGQYPVHGPTIPA